jgi:FAD/FMN-containing dehydrogenase
MVDGAVLGDDPDADAVLAPLRALHPETDTFTRVPTSSLVRLHGDPEEPVPATGHPVLLDDLPADAVEAFLSAAGPDSGSSLLAAEIRQLGGALAEPRCEHAALSHLPGRFLVFAVGLAVDAAAAAATERDVARVVDALQPWANGKAYLNFAERARDASTGFTDQTWARLRRLRATYDPHGVLHPVHAA